MRDGLEVLTLPREESVLSEPRAAESGQAPPPIEEMSFEQALAELETIVQRLERGQLDLEASIQAYERGTKLREHCEAKLEAARLRVEKLTFGPNGDGGGEQRLQPLDDE